MPASKPWLKWALLTPSPQEETEVQRGSALSKAIHPYSGRSWIGAWTSLTLHSMANDLIGVYSWTVELGYRGTDVSNSTDWVKMLWEISSGEIASSGAKGDGNILRVPVLDLIIGAKFQVLFSGRSWERNPILKHGVKHKRAHENIVARWLGHTYRVSEPLS